jgi:hypothetical protein
MLEAIFSRLPESFVAGVFAKPTSFYFSLGDLKKIRAMQRGQLCGQ